MKKTLTKKELSSVSGSSNKEAPVKQKVNEEATSVIQTSFGNSVLPLSEEEFNSISRQVNNICCFVIYLCVYISTFFSYMRGRLKLEELNDFVSAFNLTIQEKYKLISSYSLHSSNEEIYKRYQTYKSQENADTKGVYLSILIIYISFITFVIILTGVHFCTANDIKELSSMKSETTIRKMIPCLVHCKRIKENRGNPLKMIRYCLINNNWLRLHFSVSHILFLKTEINILFYCEAWRLSKWQKELRLFTFALLKQSSWQSFCAVNICHGNGDSYGQRRLTKTMVPAIGCGGSCGSAALQALPLESYCNLVSR